MRPSAWDAAGVALCLAGMAVIMAGGVATLLNGWWQGGELAEGIKMVGCRYVLADAHLTIFWRSAWLSLATTAVKAVSTSMSVNTSNMVRPTRVAP